MATKEREFTVGHFRKWAKELILDTFEPWVLEPFQEDFLEDVFAGTPAVWLVVPEGNGKTTLVGGLVLYHIQHTEEGWVPVAASTRQQAEMLYRQAEGFAMRSPKLAVTETFKCQEGYRRIKCERMRSRVQIFGADPEHGDGVIPSMDVVEELHAQKNLALYDRWRGKYGKRGGQTIVISTAGEPGSEFELRREQIRQRGTIKRQGSHVRSAQDSIVLHEWALQEGQDPEDLDAVKACNPFSAITPASLKAKFEAADFSMTHWRRFTCNLPTRSDVAAIQEKEWFDARTDEWAPEGEPIWAGLDLGWKYDTTALVPLWLRDAEQSVCGPACVLVPPRDGNFLDPSEVKEALRSTHERNPIRVLVMDITDAREIAEWAETELGCQVIQRSQQIPAKVEEYKSFTEGLRERRLFHTGDEALTSHVLNAHARLLPGGDVCFARPANSRRDPTKQDRRVIDALTSASMVHAVAMANPVSVYEERELVAV